MAKKAARKTTKSVTKSVKTTKKVKIAPAKPVKSFVLSTKQDSYLPLLVVILFASLIFLWIVSKF